MNCTYCGEPLSEGYCFDCDSYSEADDYSIESELFSAQGDYRLCDCEDYPCCGH